MYEKVTRDIRKQVSKLTLEQQKHLIELYDDAIKELAKTAKKSHAKSLSNRWAKDYRKELMRVRRELREEIRKQVESSIIKSADLGSQGQQIIMKEMFNLADIELKGSFTSMFSKVNDSVVKDIITGKLYKDNKTLSNRIWSHSKEFERDIQYVINQAMLQKKSAIDLAKDLEEFVKTPAKRSFELGKVYPGMKNKKIEYNSFRLARTSINHSYQNSTIQSSMINPYVEGIEWESALAHGRTCELCRERHGRVYKENEVPLDHP